MFIEDYALIGDLDRRRQRSAGTDAALPDAIIAAR